MSGGRSAARKRSGPVRIATRKSPLAIWQAEHVAGLLRKRHPGLRVDLVPLSTTGDRLLDAPLASAGGKGLFVKELEQALYDGRADLAVHSMKDVTVDLPRGLHLPVILAREDPRDAFVSLRHSSLAALPAGARVGTSSLRRKCQLRALRPELDVVDLRGGVNTRLDRLERGDFDAVILACAGLVRLGMAGRITESLEPETLLPAIGQGALGIECRVGDEAVEELIAPLEDAQAGLEVRAERALNRRLGGGCQVPIAGYAERRDGTLHLRALVARLDGSEILRAEATGSDGQAETTGRQVAEALLARGAAAILAEILGPGDGSA